MLGIDERALRIIWTIFLFGISLALVYFIRRTILLFALAIFFAYVLWPIVGLVERFLPKRRSWALALVYVGFVGLMVLIGFELVPAIVSEATSFGNYLPKVLVGNRLATIPLPSWLDPLRDQAIGIINTEISSLGSKVVPFVREASTRILSGLSDLLPLILIPILAFFFIKDAEQLRVNLLGAVDNRGDRTLLDRILNDIHLLLKNYIRALVLLAIASFACWAVFLSIFRYSYELLLAGMAGLLEFIPVIGPAAAGLTMLVVCGVSGNGSLLGILIFWGCYRLFADYVLNPYLMSSGVELHPLLVLFGILAGESLAGVPGMFFSIPAIAVVRVIFVNLKEEHRRHQHHLATSSGLTVSSADLPAASGLRDRA